MRAGFRCEIRGNGKLERSPNRQGEYDGCLEGEGFDFLGGRECLGRLPFMLFGLFDRVAHRAGVGPIKGFLSADEDRTVLRGVVPDHVRPSHSLESSPVATDDEKQRHGGHELAARSKDFSTERSHEQHSGSVERERQQ